MHSKRECELEFAYCFLVNFIYAKCQILFFIEHFLISIIHFEGTALENLGFLIKQDF